MLSAIGVLFACAWIVGDSGVYTPGSDIGYGLGLTGGLMMLLLFLYPLRKHLRFMHGWGPTKHWFALHMLLGIAGPLLILMHSTFRVGSLNAGVALTCMLLVAASGVAGRFIYMRIHHGLYGERARARDLQSRLAAQLQEVQAMLRSAPAVDPLLKRFEAAAFRKDAGLALRVWSFLTLAPHARWTYLRCARELRSAYSAHAQASAWADGEVARRSALAGELVRAYLASVQRAAQFATWERLFRWWHVLHVPLVYMLVLSAIAHVVAVHIY